MKKRFMLLICAVLVFICGAASVCAEDETGDVPQITVTATIADDMTIPEEGITVKIYSGKYRRVSGGGGGEYDYVSYPSNIWASDIPVATTWPWHKGSIIVIDAEEITFYPNSKSQDVVLDGLSNSSYYHPCIGYTVIDDTYMGNGGVYLSRNDISTDLSISYYPKTVISGTITVPLSDEDISYTVVAEGNKRTVKDEYGYFDTENDFAANSWGVITAGETTSEYSLDVKTGMDYTVYIVFDNKEYSIQSKNFENLTDSSVTVDFSEFVEPKKLSGTVRLPDGITDWETFYGETTEEINGCVILQNADEPYEYIDVYGFTIENGEQSADFELYDILGAENVIVYYYLYDDIQGLCAAGDYYDNTKCVSGVKDAEVITPDNQDIVINILAADTINVSVQNNSSVYNIDTVSAIVLDENGEKYIEVSALKNDNTYSLSIPSGYNRYIIAVTTSEYPDQQAYYSQKGFTRNLAEADILNVGTVMNFQ